MITGFCILGGCIVTLIVCVGILWSRIDKVGESARNTQFEVNHLKCKPDPYVSCESCKCMIFKRDAIEGDAIQMTGSVIKEGNFVSSNITVNKSVAKWLHVPYYCHRCAPGEDKVKVSKAKHTKEETGK